MGTLGSFVFVDDAGADYTSEDRRREISEATRGAARATGLGSGIGFHVLRHTAAAWMVQGGATLYQVQRVLGHSTPTLTQRHAHLAPDHLRDAVGVVDRVLAPKEDGPAAPDTTRTHVEVTVVAVSS